MTDTTRVPAGAPPMRVDYVARMDDAGPGGGSAVEVIIPGDACDAVVLYIDREFFRRKAREALGARAPEPTERYAAADPLMRGVGNALRAELRRHALPSAAFLESLAGVISIHLARDEYGARPGALGAAAGLAPGKLERVRAYIEQHLAESLRIERLAASVHMSPFHFARLFKKATGQPPHAYLTARRVERAKELLSNAGLPIVHVASSVGFQTQGHFTEVFRRHAGITPRRFRMNSRLNGGPALAPNATPGPNHTPPMEVS